MTFFTIKRMGACTYTRAYIYREKVVALCHLYRKWSAT